MTTPSVPPIALAGEPHDLSTSAGGRAYVSEFFSTRLRRHDFGSYISERLAADFACVLAKYLSEQDAAPTPSASSVPVAIYQVRASRFVSDWTDVSPTDELFHSSPEDERRIVYATRDAAPSDERVKALQDARNAMFHSRTPLEAEIAVIELLRMAKLDADSARRETK